MNEKQAYILTGGMILFALGLLVVGFDYSQLRADLLLNQPVKDGAFALSQGEGRRPSAYSKEELKSQMLQAEEYLRQNSVSSAKKALELYTNIASYDTDTQVKQMARFGLAAALYRLGDDRRALEHLRDLKRSDIADRALKDNVELLLGRILLLAGHEDEGRSILQSLLSRTTDRVIQSRVHAAFGDYYSQKGDKAQAKRSYRIAVEYDPDNFHAAFSEESVRRFADMSDVGPESLNVHFADDLFKPTKSKDTEKTAKPVRTQKRPVVKNKKSGDDTNKSLENAKKLYDDGLKLSRKGLNSDALRAYLSAIDVLRKLDSPTEQEIELKKSIHAQLEHIYYRTGETYAALDNSQKAHDYFDQVLSNPGESLDQAAYVRKGILYFDNQDYQSASQSFDAAIRNFPDGNYTHRAEQWLRETEIFLKKETP